MVLISKTQQPVILVTGATGFVGHTLLQMFKNKRVRIAIRNPENSVHSVESVVVGNIDEHTSWGDALRYVECVVHLASHVHVGRPTVNDDIFFQRTNVFGTRRLASEAARAGVKRFIFLSSVKAIGEATACDPVFGINTRPCPVDGYGKSKLLAEQSLLSIAADSNMSSVIIRPPLVYGPHVRANFRRLLALIDGGYPLPLGGIQNARSLVSVWNLCDLIKTAVEASSISSGSYLVSDGEDLSTPELIRKIAQKMERRPLLFPVPTKVLEIFAKLTGKEAEVSRLRHSLRVDISETCRVLNWAPPMSVDESLERTVRWYLSSGREK